MTLALALALAQVAPAPASAVEAERAFAADAKTLGQWTAFRRWAAPDALMFTPAPVKAQDYLRNRADPPRSVEWWPSRSLVSCDRRVAVNSGSARWPDGSASSFRTVWVRQGDGSWKWVYDNGAPAKVAAAQTSEPITVAAACTGRPPVLAPVSTATEGNGASPDGTLRWRSTVGAKGAHSFAVELWNGRRFDVAFRVQTPAAT